jgi:hypothetical protein
MGHLENSLFTSHRLSTLSNWTRQDICQENEVVLSSQSSLLMKTGGSIPSILPELGALSA